MKHKITRQTIAAWMRSIQGRSILFTLLLLALMLLAASLVTGSSQGALRQEIIRSNTMQLSAVAEQLSISLENTTDMQRELLFDADVNRLGVAPGYYTDPQKTQAILRVQDRMFMTATSTPLVKEAFFMSPSIGKTISAQSVDTLEDGIFQQLNRLCTEHSQVLAGVDGRYCVLMAYPTYTYYLRENAAVYLLGLELDANAITAYLTAHIPQDSGAMFLFAGDGSVITCVNHSPAHSNSAELFQLAQGQSAFEFTAADGEHYLAFAAAIPVASSTLTLVKLHLADQTLSVLHLQGNLFTWLMLLIFVAYLAYILHMWHTIHRPLNKLASAFRQVEQGDFSLRIHHNRKDDFSAIYHRFNRMNQRLGDLIEQVYMQTIRTQRAELKQLQSQINPHFLYNNLFMIRSLAQLGDTDSIETLSAELGEYFRYMTRLGKQEVTLLEEVEHARNYARIQDKRFSSRITLTFPKLPEALHNVTVPRLVLQPLIENAYDHGLHHTSTHGQLMVSFARGTDCALLMVEDNGDALTDSILESMIRSLSTQDDVQETTGLINIHRRLQLRCGPGYGLTFDRSALGGLRVTMRLPLQMPTDERSEPHATGTDRG